MNVGRELRQARRRRGLSVEELANRTKISLRNLRAIERNGFEQLPGGLFTRGFLRAYAREVGLQPEDIVAHYVAQHEPVPPAELQKGEGQPLENGVHEMENLDRRVERGQLLGSAVVVLVGSIVYFMLAWERPRHDADTSARESSPEVAQTAPAVGTAGSLGEHRSVAVDAEPETVHVELRPEGPCWVAATSDGEPAIQRLMNSGDRATVDARHEAVLRVGDAAACAFTINGRTVRPIGAAGKAVTLRITRDNYRDFVSPSAQ
jgi:cytoskeletal protein RodZ